MHKALLSLYKLRTLAPDVGTRALVLIATTSPAEHGKFVRHYMTDAEFEGYVWDRVFGMFKSKELMFVADIHVQICGAEYHK